MLKRWSREAQSGTVQDNMGRNIIANPNMDAILGYRNMPLKFQILAHRAANFQECILLLDNTLDILDKHIEEKINGCTRIELAKQTHTSFILIRLQRLQSSTSCR